MAKLSTEELLSRVWEECDLNDILDYGLENGYIGSESIINAAAEYNDPNKEYADDEIKDIVKDADISIVMGALKEKYFTDNIIDELDTDEILNAIGWDDVYDHFEFDFRDKEEEKYNEGYEDGHNDACNEVLKLSKDEESHPLRDGTIDEKWCYLCNELDVSYYDNNSFHKKLENLIRTLNRSTYKDRNDAQWISINID